MTLLQMAEKFADNRIKELQMDGIALSAIERSIYESNISN